MHYKRAKVQVVVFIEIELNTNTILRKEASRIEKHHTRKLYFTFKTEFFFWSNELIRFRVNCDKKIGIAFGRRLICTEIVCFE